MTAAVRLLVNIDVDDLAAGEAFYTAAFGLTPGRRFGTDMVELLGAAVPIYLLTKPSGSAIGPDQAARRDYARHWTPVHLDIEVDDLDVALLRALAAGAVLEGGVYQRPWGDLALLADPFGHGICLLRFKGCGYDELADPA